ncbi:hypothetical protein ACFE04_009671 [Oxalis oulophora]
MPDLGQVHLACYQSISIKASEALDESSSTVDDDTDYIDDVDDDVNEPTTTLEEYLTAWKKKKIEEEGVPPSRCFLPFLHSSKKLVECLACCSVIYPEDEVPCSVRGCKGVYHSYCASRIHGISTVKKFKCPQHECFICKQRPNWRCVQCTIASHDKCAPWPNAVVHLKNRPGKAICWRHQMDWPPDMEEIFFRLPVPSVQEEFTFDLDDKDMAPIKVELPAYTHIRRNIYLIKKTRDDSNDGIGCTTCTTVCSESCVCRYQNVTCSKNCRCTGSCNNRPFHKNKKVKVVKTEHCGWGVEAREPIKKGDFIIEYAGEGVLKYQVKLLIVWHTKPEIFSKPHISGVIDDRECEQRLWKWKAEGVKNFYMCEVGKGFTIDATYKGNVSRFLNHSCDPNCILEKWQVEGATRVGVFAAKSIQVGEQLTYDYRFQIFGKLVPCLCGAESCRGFLGVKRKSEGPRNMEVLMPALPIEVIWGAKRPRTHSGYKSGTLFATGLTSS